MTHIAIEQCTDLSTKKHSIIFVSVMLVLGTFSNEFLAHADSEDEGEFLGTVHVTAEEELKQSLGTSVITSKDIEKRPPVNDLSEIIRTMPGVNLTGNSATGQRGNNRQIDIRGMGPENTLILIDGKPVNSRNSVRYSWGGERDTRGDSNWVPVEEVEKIEVIRGPAAARYGSGAAGGVVNIITKKMSDEFKGSVSLYHNFPERGAEGDTKRLNFNLSGPIIKEHLSFRVYGNLNKTDADSPNINAKATPLGENVAAGREGVRNKDVNALLRWQVTPDHRIDFEGGFSRQGNIYTGDSQHNNGTTLTEDLAQNGRETNKMYRENFAISHDGTWGFGTSKLVVQYDRTKNSRMKEGLAGGPEGRISDEQFYDNLLKNYRINGEINTDFQVASSDHVLTVGAEWNKQELNDSASLAQGFTTGDTLKGIATPENRNPNTDSSLWGIFLEDNISLSSKTKVIPGLRFDHDSRFGSNWSPSLNIFQNLGAYFTLKGGIARAFKAPNLYQSNSNYLLFTRGNGCPLQISSTGSCYLLGNDDLKPEASINKELGIQFEKDDWAASVAWFRNDYKNKIISGTEVIAVSSKGNHLLQWQNSKKAVVEGIEGNITIPLSEKLQWVNNFTYMIESKDKVTGNPLSIIPKYTINSNLNWQVNEKFLTTLALTNYGKQKPRKNPTSRTEKSSGLPDETVKGYSLVSLSASYEINKYLKLSAGVSNLFDKQLSRTDGARSYNEPGRTYYLSTTVSF